jgi:hypothetical protein
MPPLFHGKTIMMISQSRREFMVASMMIPASILAKGARQPHPAEEVPWYRRTYRWGQTNITEEDPGTYDVEWWREHWKKTRVQGVIVNAGGIVAYYPAEDPLQHRAKTLGQRDLLGEIVAAAHSDGIVAMARMDSNRAHEPMFRAHPDWFAVNSRGVPYRAADLYVTCINSRYYDEYIPSVLREIVRRVHPEGFTDNSWSGLDRDSICYCENCARAFRDRCSAQLPQSANRDDPHYRKWIDWNYARRLEIWDLNNRVTRSAGGPHCIWSGMLSGDIASESRRFRDLKAICARAEIIMFDDQGRTNASGFQSNGDMGKRMHGLLGWDKLIPESMAMYQRIPTFRKSASPAPEARLWMLDGIAGGIQPWWHHVGASQEDRRQFRTAEPVYRWHEANQQYLVDRRPIATVGVVWSQANTEWYGRDQAETRVLLPYRGIIHALIRSRIPYLPVHIDHVGREDNLPLLILPNIGATSDAQAEAIRRHVSRGGALIATGETSLYDERGGRRKDFALADILGVHAGDDSTGSVYGGPANHSYLRLSPDMGAGQRHPVLKGLEDTNIVAFGGTIRKVQPSAGGTVPLTLIPDFPIYPPETSWMREPRTTVPAVILRESASRVAYLAADLDARFARDNLPDHLLLLRNIVRWSLADNVPLRVAGHGFVDCHLYEQSGRTILHLVNLTNAGTWRAPVDELIPIGPLDVKVRVRDGIRPRSARLLVAGREAGLTADGDWMATRLASVLDHEVVVLE